MREPGRRGPTVVVPATEGRRTFKVVYFFSGADRKGSVADYLKSLCKAGSYGLEFEEEDIMIGGSDHDLLCTEAQEEYLTKMEEGYWDFALFSPLAGLGVGPTGPTTTAQPHAGTETTHGASQGNGATNKRERRKAMFSSTLRYGP